ncbi:MAG: DegV family EDD domain-containing protein [Thermoleophilia bacterium]|nr:DegV family EDD domain-containing protein [Thermoleophilia bacterium]
MRTVDLDGLRVAAESWGDSLVLAGDAELLRVHVHADDVERVTTAAEAFGVVSNCVTSELRDDIAVPGTRHAQQSSTAIVYDSTADLPVAEHPDWTMVPLTVHFGETEFRDYVDLAAAEFYERLASSSTHPTTSQPAPGAFIAVYRDLLERYEHVVSIHLSAGLSGTYGSAFTAAQEFPGRVTVIDSRLVSMPLALGLGRAQDALDAGASPGDLPALFDTIGRQSACLFSVATLEYLQRGGRIGRAQALVGTLLGVHPLLAVEEGEVVPVGRVRGEARVLPELVAEFARRSAPYPTIDVAIAHADDLERAAELEALVREARAGIRSVRILTLGAVVGTHAGPGALGLAFVAAD